MKIRNLLRSLRSSKRQGLIRKLAFEPLEDRRLLAAAPPLSIDFDGITYDEDGVNNFPSFSIPPDTHGAAGTNHVVSVVNTSIEWHTKAGVQQNSQSLSSFFAPLNPVNDTFDPKAIYDQFADRFLVVTLELQDMTVGDPADTSRILVAVSDDGDPNGVWRYQAIDSSVNIQGVETWADYPGFAVDEEAVYVTANMFPFGIGPFAGTRLWIVDKGLNNDGFYANANVNSASFAIYDPDSLVGFPSFVHQPAHIYGDAPLGVGTWLVSTDFSLDTPGDGTQSEFVSVIRVDNPLNNPTFSHQLVDVGNIENNQLPMPEAPQSGSVTPIATNDRRALDVVWRGDSLYLTAQIVPEVGPDTNQATAHWWQVDTSDLAALTLTDQGNVGGEDIAAGTYTFMPSIAVDRNNNVAIGFSASAPSIFAGAYYTARLATDPPGTVRDSVALRVGEDTYVRTFGGDNRWGDYSAITIAPDGSNFWVFNEYATTRGNGIPPDDGRWATHWGSFTFGSSVSGFKWFDRDGDGIRDAGEVGLAGWTIYLDLNNNGMPDTDEPSTITAADGSYQLTGPAPATYTLAEVLQTDWRQTFPVGGTHTVNLASAADLVGVNFGNERLPTISGLKWFDRDGDGIRDVDEEGLAGWTIFLDLNSNGTLDVDEPSEITATDGSYEFAGLAPGTYTVAEVLQTNWRQTFPAAGTYTVNVVDGQDTTGIDFGNQLLGSISGFKWFDRDGDGNREVGEEPLAGWRIFLDLNGDGRLDLNEPSAVTSATGRYQFSGVIPATYAVTEERQPGFEQTFPTSAFHNVTLASGDVINGLNFGNQGPPSVSGFKFIDLDQDGFRDVGEPGFGGVYIFLDANEDGKPGDGERGVFSKANGYYQITNIEPGTYQLREVLPPGLVLTSPASGSYDITYEAGQAITGLNFGNFSQIDWGDAPAIYPTLAADDGANHVFTPGFQLGRGGFGATRVDAELDGQPSAGADLDDLTFLDDEDGVLGLDTPLVPGTRHAITVIGSPAQDAVKGKLNGWVDFNADGDWDDYGEQVFYDLIIKSGENVLWIDVPAFAPGGPTYARFRISTEWNLPAFGPARDGEVEDYVVTIDNPAIPFGPGAFVLGVTTDDTLEDLYIPGPSTLFEVTANLTGILTAQTSFDHDLGNIDLAIYNTAGELLGQSSSVTDTEQVDIRSVAGERYLIRLFGHNPKVDMRTMNMIAIDGATTIVGTPGNDTVELTAPTMTTPIACADCIELDVNGIVYRFDAPTDFVFLGLGGDDALTVNSNANDDDITFRTGSVVVTNPQYTMSAWYVKDIRVDAAEGSDTARFFNLPGPDAFTSQPEFSERIAPYLSQRADSVERVLAYADGDSDTAVVTGTSDDDRLVGGEASSFLTSPTFFVYLDAFESMLFNGGEGNNTATVSDSAGDDLAVGVGRVATMAAATFRIDMRDFARVNFVSSTGFDRANFTGSAGDDLLVGKIAGTYLMTAANFFYAHGFSRVIVDGGRGLDRAFFRGTTGVAETFVAKELDAWLVSAGSFIRGKNFETNRGFGSAEDTSVFYDTMRAENYIAQTTFVLMTSSGTDMISYAEGFGTTRAFATPGTGDKATMSDSPLDDIFYANSFAFFLSGMDFFNQGAGFDTVTATSTTGIDTLTVDGVPGFTLTIIGPWI